MSVQKPTLKLPHSWLLYVPGGSSKTGANFCASRIASSELASGGHVGGRAIGEQQGAHPPLGCVSGLL